MYGALNKSHNILHDMNHSPCVYSHSALSAMIMDESYILIMRVSIEFFEIPKYTKKCR
jgi:hypothetical protein